MVYAYESYVFVLIYKWEIKEIFRSENLDNFEISESTGILSREFFLTREIGDNRRMKSLNSRFLN